MENMKARLNNYGEVGLGAKVFWPGHILLMRNEIWDQTRE